MKKFLLSLSVLCMVSCAFAARETVPLSGSGWTADGEPVAVPHCWNISDGTDGEGFPPEERWTKNSSCASGYERKTVVYARDLPSAAAGRRYFLRCGGACIVATVKVNGREIGTHRGAFTAFAFEITDALAAEGNRLEIAVDNRVQDDLAPVNADFTMYGGLYRDVELVVTDPVCIDPATDGADGVAVFPDAATGRVDVKVSLLGAEKADIACRVTGPGISQTFEGTSFVVPSPALWSPETPNLYALEVTARSGGYTDTVSTRFGFRTVEFRPDGFYLNGVRRKLRGVNRHQDKLGKGWALSAADEESDMEMIKELGADAVRTAHYPQSSHVYDLCDKLGLIAWVEGPNVNGLRFDDAFRSNVWRTAREMVAQNRNHPSIFVWSIFNELYNKVPMREGEPEAMMEEFNAYMKSLDSTRPTVAASDRPDKKRLNAISDVFGTNRYPGWYQLDAYGMTALLDEICGKNAMSSLALSEYGAGGGFGTQGLATEKVRPSGACHPMPYQAFVHREDYRLIRSDPRVWGAFVWVMFDLGSDCRREGERFGVNDKGLVCFDHRTKKDAYWLYRANWTNDPVLHLVGGRFDVAPGRDVDVLVFSNIGTVTLEVNGKIVGEKAPDEVKSCLWRGIRLAPGVNSIAVRAGGLVRNAFWTLPSETH